MNVQSSKKKNTFTTSHSVSRSRLRRRRSWRMMNGTGECTLYGTRLIQYVLVSPPPIQVLFVVFSAHNLERKYSYHRRL